jgi:type II secretory pathway component PulF
VEFKYKAKKSLDKIAEGTIEADSIEHVVEKLEQQGMSLISVEPLKPSPKKSQPQSTNLKSNRWSSKQLTLFTQKLHNLIKSQVELITALRLIEQASDNLAEKTILENTIKNIKEGITFSQSLSRYPRCFPVVYINIIRAGESSGRLKDSLAQLLNYLRRIEGLRSKVKQAIAYPTFMIIVGAAMIFIMLTFILPRLASVFEDFQASLPLPTVILLGISHHLRAHWILYSIFIVFVIIGLKKFLKTELFIKVKYRIPLVRNLIYKQTVADFSTSVSLLLKSGLTLLSAIEVAAPIISNPVYIKQLEQVRQDIKDGISFSKSLVKYKVFPDFFIQMIKVGEESGRLDEVLEDISESYQQQIEEDLKIVTSLLEPAIILVLGLIIGGMVIAMLLPIFTINTIVG